MHRVFSLQGWFTCLAVALAAAGAAATERDQRTEVPAAVGRTVSFSKDVQPLLAARCGQCHLNGKKSGGFRMDSRELFLKGGDSGPVVKVGASGDSPLVRLVAALEADNRMPPRGPILSNEHVGILRAWIDQGLKWEDGTAAAKDPKDLTAAEAEAAGLCPVQKIPSKLVYHTILGGQKYHFCCPECKKQFLANPAEYGAAVPATAEAPRTPAPVAAGPVGAGLPRPHDALALSRLIDEHIDRRLAEKKLPTSPASEDAEFLRRVYLDLHGVIPPADRVVAFLNDRRADKRARVIDELLAAPQYGRHLADVWDDLLLPRDLPGAEAAVAPLTRHLEKQFNANVPWDQVVRGLLTARGTHADNGGVIYQLANRTTPMVVDSVSRVFLALPLECAQCHDHPYARWQQADYWGLAAFFAGINRPGLMKTGSYVSFAKDKSGVLQLGSAGVEERPRELRIRLPVPPDRQQRRERGDWIPVRFPGAPPLNLPATEPVLARPLAAQWLTGKDNPYFARAAVNRFWWHFFGQGLVNPVDDMFKPEATVTHPELLDALAAQFVASGFDLKHLTRAICNSQTYQRTSKSVQGNEGDTQLYSRMPIKVLTPEQLWDSLVLVFGREPAKVPNPLWERRPTVALPRGEPRTQRGLFIKHFRGENTAAPTDYTQGIPQALRLMNGVQFNNVEELLGRLAPADGDPAKVVETLYLTALSRPPTREDSTHMIEYVKCQHNRGDACADVLWALLRSSEFAMNH
jgi:YHS domain-containing protein